MAETRYSYCRNCTANCGTVFDVDQGRVVTSGRDTQNAISNGFICIKGEMAANFLSGGEPRVRECLARNATGSFAPIDAPSAMDSIASSIGRIVGQHGPRSLALFYGTAAYGKSLAIPFGKSFMAALGSPNLFSTMTIDQSAHWVVDCRMGVFATSRPFVQDIDLLVIAGANPLVSHQSLFFALPPNQQTQHIKALKARGGKLIVIDPRRTETARLADIHLQPRPGFDSEIFACLIRTVLENEWHDVEFCKRYVTNLAALKHAVEPFTLELTAERAGVDTKLLVEIARLVGHARKPSIGFATGVSMSANPNTAAHMVEALNAIRGGFARAGDTVHHPGFFIKKALTERVIPPRRSWEMEPRLRGGEGQLFGEFPSARLADEIINPGEGQIRALIVLGGNPVMAFGEPGHLISALKSLELLVVIDPRMTETAQLAHYVVAPPVQYEVSDFTLFNDTKFIKPFVQFTHPVVPAPPGTIEEWRFFNGIANRLGHVMSARSMSFGAAGGAAAQMPLSPDVDWQTNDIIRWYFDQAGLSFDEVASHPHGFEPKIDVPVIEAPTIDDGARLDLCPPDVAAELVEVLATRPRCIARYQLVNRRIVETFNSAFRASEITRRRHQTNSLYIHPDDMAQDGFAEGDFVSIAGEHGQIGGYLKADATLRRGVVAMTHCWGAADPTSDPQALQGSHTSRLVSMRREHVQKIDGMPRQSALPVTITKLEKLADHA